MNSVLLLALNWRDTDAMGAMEGTAIGLPLEFVYLSSGLTARGIEHTFVDAWLYDRTIPELEDEVRAAKIVVICSAPSYLFWRDGITNIELASRSVRQLKALNPDVLVALVGPHGTVDPESFLEMGLDFLFRGEPDETFPELAERILKGEPYAGIPGIVDARAGLAAERGCSVEVPDLGALPPTDLSRFRLGDYPFPPASGPPALLRGKIATLYEASRGCPYACIYCFKIGFRDKYRVKPPERIDRELAELAAAGVGYVYLIDEIFFLKRKWALEILPLFAKHGIAWGCQTRASAILPEIVTAVLDTGTCGLIQIGLEHTNSEVLAAIGKSETDVVALADALHRLTAGGVKVQLFLVSGLPGDDPSKHAELAETLATFPMDRVDCIVHPAMPFPGTKLWEQGVAEGHGLSGWDDVERAAGMIGSSFSTKEEVELESFRLAGRVREVSDRARIRRAIREGRLPRPADFARLAKHRLDIAAPRLMGELTRRRQTLRSGPLLSRRRKAPQQGRHLIVGPGGIARAHAQVLAQRGQPLGVVGRNAGRARGFASEWPGTPVFASLSEALDDPEVHSVVICLPPHAHEEACLSAIRAGKHVLLEKPVSHDVASARRILSAYESLPLGERGALLVAEQMRYLPFTRSVRSFLGNCAKRTYRFVERRTSRPQGWRLDAVRAGGGVLLDVGVHYVALAKEVFGEVVESTTEVVRRDERGLALDERVTLEHLNGARGVVEVAWGAESDELSLEIGGQGALIRYRLDSRVLWVGARPHPIALRGLNGRHQLVGAYLDAIASGTSDEGSLSAAVNDMELVLGAQPNESKPKGRRPLPTA